MNKKIISLATALLLLFGLCIQTGFAAQEPAYSVQSKSVYLDDVFTVDVSIQSNPGIISLRFGVTYDREKLELLEVADSTLLKGFSAPAPTISSPYSLRWADSLSTVNNTASGTVVTLKFKALATGTATVGITHKEARSATGQEIVFADTSASVTVAEKPASYQVVFIAEGKTVDTVDYTVGTESITPPAVPKQEGKFNGRWGRFDLSQGGDITVYAIYEDAMVSVIPQKTLYVGDTYHISVGANFTVTGKTFLSDTPSVVTVDKKGTIRAVGTGNGQIAVTLFGVDDFGNPVSADGYVTVIALENAASDTEQAEENTFRSAFEKFFRTTLHDAVAFWAHLLRTLAFLRVE